MTATPTDPRPTGPPLTRNGGEFSDTGHTGGLPDQPADHEQRTTTFLDQALGLKETS